jgi:hypothetical protein
MPKRRITICIDVSTDDHEKVVIKEVHDMCAKLIYSIAEYDPDFNFDYVVDKPYD